MVEGRRKNSIKENRKDYCVGDKMELEIGTGVHRKKINK